VKKPCLVPKFVIPAKARIQRKWLKPLLDESLVATLIEDMLESAGCLVSGPIPRVAEALDAVDHETL
jgi:hypothetical protein